MEKISDDSDFYKSIGNVTKNMVIDNTSTGEIAPCNVVVESSQLTIAAGVGLTISQGKKAIIDIHDVFS